MSEVRDYREARAQFHHWETQLKDNLLRPDSSLMHTYQCYFAKDPEFIQRLKAYADRIPGLETVVMENNKDNNLPAVEHYNAFGERADRVIHHPSYVDAGNIIYGSGLMAYLLQPGEMLKTLSLFLLSSHAGEAGHHCPIACSAGVIRVLNQQANVPETADFLDKLSHPSFSDNFTGAQFLTEIQGGSDVGANACRAYQDEGKQWRIEGEKWFCSNANADLILLTARYDDGIAGTKGLGLFLVPQRLPDGRLNHYRIRRLKQKIGTRSMATGEIDFEQAVAYPMGEVQQGIHLVMENVLHLSRIFNAFSVLGMARRACQTAYYYACNRQSFGKPLIHYPLVKETLAHIQAENTAMMASIFHMVRCQDELDASDHVDTRDKLLLRTLANINKYFTAKRSVENIHHCLDILAGNGTIETFSSLPRLLRDCIVCENWEGTHFTLWMQILKDIHKLNVDDILFAHLSQLLTPLGEVGNALFGLSLKGLIEDTRRLKTLPMDEQTLLIGPVVEEMAVLTAAVTLARELQANEAPSSKSSALTLFIHKYLHKEYQVDKKYLDLLDDVLGGM
ncbi:acyl-CoA dehydrogenase [Legionella sp. MW5194]|uniref:acyl-CoA dehydrogenase family protein n=1 Tax=Legionella sp. MW5194 TaxID=2662448 RepID=UPI00193CB148|nr:acyl-CoA dehydrogenase family protein [Legionella sp. MW5194]QRN03601.1 acyl-CoA dehydrogenase [Legionella sp. MW5194]